MKAYIILCFIALALIIGMIYWGQHQPEQSTADIEAQLNDTLILEHSRIPDTVAKDSTAWREMK